MRSRYAICAVTENTVAATSFLVLLIFLTGCRALPATQNNLHPPIESTHTIAAADTTADVEQTSILPSSPTPNLESGTVLSPETTASPTSLVAIELDPEELYENVVDLLQTNLGCRLPCWWGIFPGETKVTEIESLLSTYLGSNPIGFNQTLDIGHLDLGRRPYPNGFRLRISLLDNESEVISLINIYSDMQNEQGEPDYRSQEYKDIMGRYMLPEFLSAYGQPEAILLRSFSELAGMSWPAQILLHYPDEGIVAKFFSRNLLTREGEYTYHRICPLDSFVNLVLYDPAAGWELSDVLVIGDNYSAYKELELASNMDPERFMQTYRNATECATYIETPENIWPPFFENDPFSKPD